MTARVVWARTRRCWRLHTWQHILFSDGSLFSLRFSNERVYWRCGESFTDQCVNASDRCGGESCMGWNFSWCTHSAQNCSRNIECRSIQIRYSWSYCSALSATASAYEIYISQVIRYSRACGSYQDFVDRGILPTNTLLNQGSYWWSWRDHFENFRSPTWANMSYW